MVDIRNTLLDIRNNEINMLKYNCHFTSDNKKKKKKLIIDINNSIAPGSPSVWSLHVLLVAA